MNELQKNSAHWRGVCLKINISIALVITTIEIIMSFSLHFQNLILQETLFEYISDYFIFPNVIIWGGMLVLVCFSILVNKNKEYLQSKKGPAYECGSLYDDLLNGALILMLTVSVGTAAYVHYIFRVTVVGFCVPIFLCIVFYSKKICIQTIITSEIFLILVFRHRYLSEKVTDTYIFEDVAIIMVFVLVVGIIAIKLIKHMKLQYEQTVEAREAAEIANQAKSTFLANMSHELRTPINAVMGMDEMILRTSHNDDILSYALDIKNASNSLLSIINDVLDVSKIESGKMELFPLTYDLSSLIHDVYNAVAIRAKDKGIDLILDIDENLPNYLIGDDLRIRQIINNLLTNGVKYTINGSVTLKMTGKSVDNGILLCVSVKDTGIGIKEEDMPKLLEKFQRIEEGRNRAVEGTGLGMSIVANLLDLMGSSLKVESQYGEGSRFSFELLQGIEGSTEVIGNLSDRFNLARSKSENRRQEHWIAPKAKILVVDDNSMNIKVFMELMKHSMIRIDKAENGEECLKKVSQVQYDLIFLDDMMPGLSGMETLTRMMEMKESQCTQTPVIAFTANAVKGSMEKYLEAGFDAYLSKPIMPDKLERIILDFIDSEMIEYGMEEDSDDLSLREEEVLQLPDIMGIDWNYGLSVWGDKALLYELATDFYEDLPNVMEILSSMESQVEKEENMTSFCIKVHALKGSAATIGALPLSSMARLLEKAAREKDAEKLHILWPYLRELMEEYLDNMKVLEH